MAVDPRARGRVALAATLALSLALLPLALVIPRIVAGVAGISPASDFALLELSTGEAARGAQLVGPYSRFGWRHPGPLYFYLMAPFHALSGGSSAALPVAAVVINWAALVAMVLALRRWAEGLAPALLALALGLAYGGYLGPGFLYNIWNPAVTVLPLGLYLIGCAALACGHAAVLPALVLVGSFLVQTHVGFLPCVGAAALVAAVLWARGPRAPARVALIVAVGAAAAALVVAWALPLYEQLTRTPGNLTLMARWFSGRGNTEHPGFGEAVAVVAREVAWPFTYAFFGARDQYAPLPALGGARLAAVGAFFAAQLALLGLWSLRLRDRPFTRALAQVSLACTAAAVVAMMRVSGEIRPYLTTWISMVGLIGTIAALAPLSRFLPDPSLPPAARATARLALPVGLAIAVAMAARPAVYDSRYPAARLVSDAVVKELARRGRRRPQVKIQTRNPDLFYGASAVLLQMHKRDVAFAVDRPWWNFFGERWLPTGQEDEVLDFHAGPRPGAAPPLVCSPEGPGHLCVTIDAP